MNKEEIVAIIDADTLVWLIAYNLQHSNNVKECESMTNTFIRTILNNTDTNYYLGFLGGEGNFRKQLSTDYKAKRPSLPDFFNRWSGIIKDILVNEWGFERVNGIEAEDAVIYCANYYKDKANVVICHTDKDLNFWEGNHYHYQNHESWTTDKLGAIYVHKGQVKGKGLKFFYSQLLQGDKSCDGVAAIGGGFGAVRIYKLLNDAKSEYSLFRRTYSTFLRLASRERFELAWRLIRMLDYPVDGLDYPTPIKYKKKDEFNVMNFI